MHDARARALGLLLVFAAVAASLVGCGGDASEPAVRDTVGSWLNAWTQASGPAREEAAAATARRVLAGDLLARAETVGRAPAGAPHLARLYNELVGLAIPPDAGFDVLTVQVSGDSARVFVRLRYSDAAAGTAAAAGLIPFNQVAALLVLTSAPPQRVFTVTRIAGEWRITAIDVA